MGGWVNNPLIQYVLDIWRYDGSSLPHQILILYLISLVKFLSVILLLLLTASNIIGTVEEPGNCHTGSNQWSISPSTLSPRVVSTSCFRQRNTTAGSSEIICLEAKFPLFSITGWFMPWSLEIYIPPRILAYEVRYCPCLLNLWIGIKTEKARKEYKRLGQWGNSSVIIIPHAVNFLKATQWASSRGWNKTWELLASRPELVLVDDVTSQSI